MTDVPDLVRVAAVAPLGSSDYSSLSGAISMAQAIPNLCVSRSVLMKHQVNWTLVRDAIGELPGRSIWSADNPVERLHANFTLLVERFVPSKVIRKDMPWFNGNYRRAFNLKQEVHLRWTHDLSRVNWDEFIHYQRRTNEVYAEAGRQFRVRSLNVLMNAQCPYKWWYTLKSAVFGSSSGVYSSSYWVGGGLVCELVGKAEMLSAHFDGKQSRDPVDQPSTCHPSPCLTTFVFRSWEVRRLLLDLDSCGGTDPLGMFPHFGRGQLMFWPVLL